MTSSVTLFSSSMIFLLQNVTAGKLRNGTGVTFVVMYVSLLPYTDIICFAKLMKKPDDAQHKINQNNRRLLADVEKTLGHP